jgi:prepilin signal peptidase PulO-like enzyme (type II secretory pathway)
MTLLISFLIGICSGSFFYTLALRSTSGMTMRKILFTFSKCPQCGKRVSLIGLIPVVGFFLQRGKCSCGFKIPYSYPAFELLCGTAALLVQIKFGISILSLMFFLAIANSFAAAICDVAKFRIPDVFSIVMVLLALPSMILRDNVSSSLISFAVVLIIALALGFFFAGAIGGGDIKYASALALFLGFPDSIIALEATLIIGSISGILYAAVKKKGLRIRIPLAPFLTVGLIIAIYFSTEIMNFYYQFMM